MLNRTIFILTLLALLVTACAAQPQAQTERPAAKTEAPPATGSATATTPTQKPTQKIFVKETGTTPCIEKPLAEAVLMKSFRREISQLGLIPVDPETGREICGIAPLEYGQTTYPLLSPDGSQLALIHAMREDMSDGTLRFIDLQNWETLKTEVALDNWVRVMAYSPDSSLLAIATAHQPNWNIGPSSFDLRIVDARKGLLLSEASVDFEPWMLGFVADGAGLVVYGSELSVDPEQEPKARISLIRTNDGVSLWDESLREVSHGFVHLPPKEGQEFEGLTWIPGFAFDSAKDSLYIVHADEEKLTTVDLTSRTISTIEIQEQLSFIERLLAATAGVAHAKMVDGTTRNATLSPDGSRLYVVSYTDDTGQDSDGNYTFDRSYHGLQVIDPQTGAELAKIETEGEQLVLSEDGARIFLRNWSTEKPWTEIIDAQTLEVISRVANQLVSPARRLSGEPVLLAMEPFSSRSFLYVLDPDTFEQVMEIGVLGSGGWLGMP